METAKRYRYTGKERDEESGLCYHEARYHAPWVGRWATCDPLGLEDGTNLYGFAGNNPVRFVDPDGTQKIEVDDANMPKNDVVYTSDPLMAKEINQLTGHTLEQALDLSTGESFPVGAAGGMFVSRYAPELSPHVPNLIVVGGYDVQKAFRNYFIKPEHAFVDENENTTVIPASIVDLGVSYGPPDLSEILKMLGDVTMVGSLALKAPALLSSLTRAPSATASIAGVHAKVAKDAMTLSFRSVDEQVSFLVSNVPGAEAKQMRLLVEKAFEKQSSVVLGGSRVRGSSRLGSDLDVGFGNLTPNQAAKLSERVTKTGPLQLERTRIVPGNETPNIPKIVSPEEFFQRVGVRAARDVKAGEVFFPSGSVTVTPGMITYLPPGIRP
jgi:RHS repeat-associated protein